MSLKYNDQYVFYSSIESNHLVPCTYFDKLQTNEGGGDRGVNLPSPYFLSQFLPPPSFFEPITPSSQNGYVSFSPSSLLFPPISPSSQIFLGHFSLLPILFLPPPNARKYRELFKSIISVLLYSTLKTIFIPY